MLIEIRWLIVRAGPSCSWFPTRLNNCLKDTDQAKTGRISGLIWAEMHIKIENQSNGDKKARKSCPGKCKMGNGKWVICGLGSIGPGPNA